jgi:hypothetical protein
MEFDGQQSDEKILTVITPHTSRFILSTATAICVCIFILGILYATIAFLPTGVATLRVIVTIISLVVLGIALWWFWKTQTNDRTYVTDRRIIRFDVVTPFFTNKRGLFWNEVLKVKAYSTNMFFRLMKVGSLQIEPVAAEHESIVVPDVYYHEDLANYIDKIIFTFKNKPGDISTIKPFVPLPKGHRG